MKFNSWSSNLTSSNQRLLQKQVYWIGESNKNDQIWTCVKRPSYQSKQIDLNVF